MNLLFGALIVIAATAVAIATLLLVRRNAPDGSYFHDGDRAAGVFGVLATGFSVLLGFIVFLAFASYDASRSGAETEAQVVLQQYQTAQFLPQEATLALTGELVCYARYVVEQEWPLMQDGALDDEVNPWGLAMFATFSDVEPQSTSEEAAYSEWLDQTTERQDARVARLHGAEGIIPVPLWIVLVVTAIVIFVFMLFFADSGERSLVQALQIGSVVAVMVATILLIRMLHNPFQEGVGGLDPVAMQRTLNVIEGELGGVGIQGPPPCSGSGEAA